MFQCSLIELWGFYVFYTACISSVYMVYVCDIKLLCYGVMGYTFLCKCFFIALDASVLFLIFQYYRPMAWSCNQEKF